MSETPNNENQPRSLENILSAFKEAERYRDAVARFKNAFVGLAKTQDRVEFTYDESGCLGVVGVHQLNGGDGKQYGLELCFDVPAVFYPEEQEEEKTSANRDERLYKNFSRAYLEVNSETDTHQLGHQLFSIERTKIIRDNDFIVADFSGRPLSTEDMETWAQDLELLTQQQTTTEVE